MRNRHPFNFKCTFQTGLEKVTMPNCKQSYFCNFSMQIFLLPHSNTWLQVVTKLDRFSKLSLVFWVAISTCTLSFSTVKQYIIYLLWRWITSRCFDNLLSIIRTWYIFNSSSGKESVLTNLVLVTYVTADLLSMSPLTAPAAASAEGNICLHLSGLLVSFLPAITDFTLHWTVSCWSPSHIFPSAEGWQQKAVCQPSYITTAAYSASISQNSLVSQNVLPKLKSPFKQRNKLKA